MTTPAIHRDVLTYAGATRHNLDFGWTISMGDRLATRDLEDRPASANAERVGGFKKCASWTHRGDKWRKLPATNEYTSSGLRFRETGNIWDGSFPEPDPVSSNTRNQCLVKALEKLKNQDFHLGNFLAESRQAIDMVANRSLAIADQVRGFRRRNPKAWKLVRLWQTGGLPRHLWCKIPPAWLELQYGWLPLMADVQGALAHLKKRGRFARPFVTVKASAETDSVSKLVSTSSDAVTAEVSFNHHQVVTTYLVYGLENPTLAELSSLGLVNPLEIVWETTRYSFVVDWFLPIGSWLGALTADVGYSFITGGQGSKVTCTFRDSVVLSHSPFYTYSQIQPPQYIGKTEFYERRCYGTTPVPGIYVKNPLSLKHVLNAFALLAQAFR